MGYEVKLHYHPRKEDGGYDFEKTEVLNKKVGKPFEETTLEVLAGFLISQMARRDMVIFDVEIEEFVRRSVSFKECKDGRGIILKGKRFSLDDAAKIVAEEIEVVEEQSVQIVQQLQQNPTLQPHEIVAIQQQGQQQIQPQPQPGTDLDVLYSQPDRSLPLRRQSVPMPPVNQKKIIYWVYFEPGDLWRNEAAAKGLKFQEDKKYPVHQIVPHPSGRLDAQEIVVTDDTGRPIKTDEKYFTTAGMGLVADAELGFSRAQPKRNGRKTKLMYEDEMSIAGPIEAGIPIDDGSVPPDMLKMPDLRPGKAY